MVYYLFICLLTKKNSLHTQLICIAALPCFPPHLIFNAPEEYGCSTDPQFKV